VKAAKVPAPDSTTTSKSSLPSLAAMRGTTATRFSPAWISFRTPSFIR
jgi:hypothetical protein